MTAVTPTRKRYAVPCVVCNGLYPTYRTDSRTCSTACRVALHRGSVDTYAQAAAHVVAMFGGKPDPFGGRLLRAAAILRPELVEEIKAGRIEDPREIGAELYGALIDLYHADEEMQQ